MLACILEELGFMENNTWIDEEFLTFVSNALNNDQAKVKKVESIMKNCQQEKSLSGSDRCEMASKITECLKKDLKKEKIDIGI